MSKAQIKSRDAAFQREYEMWDIRVAEDKQTADIMRGTEVKMTCDHPDGARFWLDTYRNGAAAEAARIAMAIFHD